MFGWWWPQGHPWVFSSSLRLFYSRLDGERLTLLGYTQNVPRSRARRGSWSTKQRRAFQRILSGIKRANNEGKRLRIITLTSSVEKRSKQHEMGKAWQVLRKRISRQFGMSIEYYRLRTNEGNGVLHIIYKGGFIPQRWLKNAWNEIWESPIVFIQALRGEKRLARYLVTHYMAGHSYQGVFVRGSWSWGWVFRGFVRTWRRVLSTSVDMQTAIYTWNVLLRTRNPGAYYLENRKKKRWKESLGLKPLTAYLGFR